jgi:hypothetical protein
MARPNPEVIQLGPTANDVSFSVSAGQAACRASGTAAVVGVAVNFEYPILFWTARDVRSPRSPTSAARPTVAAVGWGTRTGAFVLSDTL